MNCPNCGAENEAGVRFCIECGTPLEDQTILEPPAIDDDDSDQTILTTVPRVAEDAKTVSITQEDVAAAVEIEVEQPPSPPTPEPEAPQPAMPPPPPPPPAGGDSGGKSNRNIIIIVIVVLLVLCCCCATLGIVGAASSDVMDDILYELSFLPQTFVIV